MDQPPVLYDPDKVDQLEITPFLRDVIEYTRNRVATRKHQAPLSGISALTTIQRRPVPLASALPQRNGPSLIATIKAQSLNGDSLINAENYNPEGVARAFGEAGARALAVATNPKYYQGDLHHMMLVAGEVTIPVIRHDFIFDEYQVIESRAAGADGITLVVAMLGQQRLRNLLSLTQRLCMTAVVIVHNEDELKRALELDPRIIGINNRDWKDFSVDLGCTERLVPYIPRHIVKVSIGGINTPEDLLRVAQTKVDAVQIGSKLMDAPDPIEMVSHLYSLLDVDPTDPWKSLE